MRAVLHMLFYRIVAFVYSWVFVEDIMLWSVNFFFFQKDGELHHYMSFREQEMFCHVAYCSFSVLGLFNCDGHFFGSSFISS